MSDTKVLTLECPIIDEESSPEVDQTNARILLHVLQEAQTRREIPEGFNRIVCNFSGSGDSTDTLDWTMTNGTDSQRLHLSSAKAQTLAPVPVTEEDLFDKWVWNISFRKHGGWYNNEGGYGELIVDLAAGTIVFEMYEAEQTYNQVSDDTLVDLPAEAAEQDEAEDDEKPNTFLNHYQCPSCSHQWSDPWTAMCDDDCPACGHRHVSPHRSDDI